MTRFIAIAAVAAIGFAAPAWAASDAECQDMWKKADINADGVLSDAESARYVALMRIGNKVYATEGKITQAEFMDACKADIYAPRKAEAGAPLKGANSFTEGQAKDRAVAQGLGIWRGSAQEEGKPVQIAVDYKGNVVTTAQQ